MYSNGSQKQAFVQCVLRQPSRMSAVCTAANLLGPTVYMKKKLRLQYSKTEGPKRNAPLVDSYNVLVKVSMNILQ